MPRQARLDAPDLLQHIMDRGYAVTFNKRHKRSGHLFQNRYKLIVCEEDSYLLELIRYIHLNSLRAGLVKNLKKWERCLGAGTCGGAGAGKIKLFKTDVYVQLSYL